jgi:hypothetical protein
MAKIIKHHRKATIEHARVKKIAANPILGKKLSKPPSSLTEEDVTAILHCPQLINQEYALREAGPTSFSNRHPCVASRGMAPKWLDLALADAL